jgi:hypothetical protein
MNGGKAGPLQKMAALSSEDNGAVHEGAGRKRAEGSDKSRLDQEQFLIEPPAAYFHLLPVWALMKPPFAAALVLEMLYGVRDVDGAAVEACLFQCPVEDAASRANKWPTFEVLVIAGLFADHQQERA